MEIWIALAILAILAVSRAIYHWRKMKYQRNAPRTDYIREVRWKILHNPFDNQKWYWVKLDPVNHVWKWECEASDEDVKTWLEQPENIQRDGIPAADTAF